MYQDAQQLLSDAQALSATAASTNLIDLGAANRGTGEVMCVMVSVDVAADVANADETYQFDIQTDDNAAFSSAVVLNRLAFGVSGFPAASKLAAGYKFALVLPKCDLVERFLRLNYTLAGTTPSVTVSASLMPYKLVEQLHVFADAITIS
jgi:hypothetical protein